MRDGCRGIDGSEFVPALPHALCPSLFPSCPFLLTNNPGCELRESSYEETASVDTSHFSRSHYISRICLTSRCLCKLWLVQPHKLSEFPNLFFRPLLPQAFPHLHKNQFLLLIFCSLIALLPWLDSSVLLSSWLAHILQYVISGRSLSHHRAIMGSMKGRTQKAFSWLFLMATQLLRSHCGTHTCTSIPSEKKTGSDSWGALLRDRISGWPHWLIL